MNSDVALYWLQQSLETTLLIAAPLLGAALAVGLMVSLFQAVTSMQEMTISYIPKIVVIGAMLFLLAPWMLEMITDFATSVFTFIPSVSQ